MRRFSIAIDGPVAAGKGTVARLLAERLGWLYVDTGAMYRSAALLGLRHGLSLNDGEEISRLLEDSRLEMRNPSSEEKDGRLTTIVLDGEDVSWKIRTEEVGQGASKVAACKQVREVLVGKQRQIASTQNVVMEGRDITFRVLPEADLKIFLTADEEERARRRHKQLLLKGKDVDYETVLKDLKERDARDAGRKSDPLQVVDDAWVIDTTDMGITQVVDKILGRLEQMGVETDPDN